MIHLIIVPFILPLMLGAVLTCLKEERIRLIRSLSVAVSVLLLLVSVLLLNMTGEGQVRVYAMGNWQPPFGITFVLDRLSALMLFVTAALALPIHLYAICGDDRFGRYFHPLFLFQLAGINGAFLTGDLFNLFVCFEILLIASYALLLHGLGAERLRSAVHYVVLNLIGSSMFLLGVGILYGVAGTLNMVDLARFIAGAEGDQRQLLQAAGWVLILVFALKAAVLPLHFWLARAYSSASAPVAALFAIMTKVGLYAILRTTTLIFGGQEGGAAGFGVEVLFVAALLTIAFGALGAFSAQTLHKMVAYLVLVSVGTLLAGISIGTEESLTASLYYLLHSTWGIAGLFLLADVIAKQRGRLASTLTAGTPLLTPNRLSGLFFIGAIAIAGLPPLSGFIGKLALLQSARGEQIFLLWTVLLLASLMVIVALSRAGTRLFWLAEGEVHTKATFHSGAYACTLLLIGSSLLLVFFAEPLMAFCRASVQQILQPELYMRMLTEVNK